MPPKLFDTFDKITQALDENPTLAARLDRIITTLIAVTDHQIPAAIEWGSTAFSRIPLQRADGTAELEVLCGWRKRSRFAGITLQYKIVR